VSANASGVENRINLTPLSINKRYLGVDTFKMSATKLKKTDLNNITDYRKVKSNNGNSRNFLDYFPDFHKSNYYTGLDRLPNG